MKKVIGFVVLLTAVGGSAWFISYRPYSIGQRVGYVQKLARSGGPCKTWEGEMTMMGAPLASGDKFRFSIPSDTVAATVSANTGKLVALHYDQHKVLLIPCFGRSQYLVTGIRVIK